MRLKSFLFFALLAFPLAAPADDSRIDPRARGVLDEMVRAYRRLKCLDQESAYDSKGSAAARILRSRLVLEKPNKLLLEIQERSPTKPSIIRRFVSDGKDLYSYNEEQGYFTRDKAPKNLEGFRQLAASVEMAAVTGADPFAALSQQAKTVKIEEPVNVSGVLCDVVLVDVGDAARTGEVRFYVGRDDRLLRKFLFDSKPIPKPEPKEKKLLPDLPIPSEDAEPLPPLEPEIPIRFGYEVKINTVSRIPKETFLWVAPSGALQLLGANAYLNQDGGKPGSGGPPRSTIAPYVDLSRPGRPITVEELYRKAKKQRRDR